MVNWFKKKFLSEKDIEGIHELDDNAPLGEDPIKFLELDDEIIDFELTSNRGDLLSILGMAYEIGAIYGTKVKDIDWAFRKYFLGAFRFRKWHQSDPTGIYKTLYNMNIRKTPNGAIVKVKDCTSAMKKVLQHFLRKQLTG